MQKFTITTILPAALASIGGAAWLIGGESLLGPLLSLLLPIATTISSTRKQAWLAALVYYLIGTVSIPNAITGYHGTQYIWLGLLAWTGSSATLALPWMFGRSAIGRLFALIVTAIPPLGFIGWLSPLNAVGVMFPTTSWLGIVATMILIVELQFIIDLPNRFVKTWSTPQIAARTTLIAVIISFGLESYSIESSIAKAPTDWIGLQTHIRPALDNLQQELDNRQALIDAAIQQGQHARVVVFPEAILNDWWNGTQQQLATTVPQNQTWIIGAQVDPALLPSVSLPGKKPINAVVAVEQDKAKPFALTVAAGLLLGGNWTPWNSSAGLQPVHQQRTFKIDGQKVWASLCVEQLQPWTWLLAMTKQPTVILAMSNGWWAPIGSFAPRIQIASTKAWARLMDVPVVWATNFSVSPT